MIIQWSLKQDDIISESDLLNGGIYDLKLNKCPLVPEGIPIPILDLNNNEIGSCEIIIDKATKLKKVKIISLNK